MAPLSLDDLMTMLDQPRRYERYILARCPFPDHDDTEPSMLVFPDGRFQCLGCGRRGWHDEFIPLLGRKTSTTGQNQPIPKLPTNLPDLEDLVEVAHAHLLTHLGLQSYLRKRGVAEMIEPARMGWWENFYTIPVYTDSGTLAGLMCRADPTMKYGTRFYQPEGQKPMLYCPDWRLLRTAPHIFVVYGMFDALALARLRLPVVTTIGGKDSFQPAWLDGWRKRVIIVPDQGEEEAANKLANQLSWRGVVLRVKYPSGTKDPADILERKGKKALLSALGGWVEL